MPFCHENIYLEEKDLGHRNYPHPLSLSLSVESPVKRTLQHKSDHE